MVTNAQVKPGRAPAARSAAVPLAGRQRIFRAGAWGVDKVDDVAPRIRPDSQGKSLASAVNLKFLSVLRHDNHRNFKFKTRTRIIKLLVVL